MKREYYRHSERGDLGWLVEEHGRLMIHLDRPVKELVAYTPGTWVLDTYVAQMSRLQIATVAYAADMQLCYHTGTGKRKDWLNLTEDQRLDWMRNGPSESHKLRRRVYEAVIASLQDDAAEGGQDSRPAGSDREVVPDTPEHGADSDAERGQGPPKRLLG